MTTRIVTDSNGRKHITNEPLLHPPKREWVGLTLEQKQHLNEVLNLQGRFQIIDAIEAKLKAKNSL